VTDLTDFAKGQIISYFMRGESVSPPAQWYIALFLSPTADDGSGLEVDGAGYVRQPILFGALQASVETRNIADIVFPAAGENWGVVTYFALYDAESGGHMWLHGPLDDDIIVEASQMLEFTPNSVIVSFQ
jgi:hypothetical protein